MRQRMIEDHKNQIEELIRIINEVMISTLNFANHLYSYKCNYKYIFYTNKKIKEFLYAYDSK